ncbi:uncharacterized protein [Aristolochia californica]|uniref:uncharacterized protein n=1 Tax=Aristolochia californica TaxID=171875 RepID=UPI0035DF3BDC
MAPSVEKLCRYLCSVRDLYHSAHECLQMQNTQQVHHKNRVEEELDESLRLLDVIGMTRDVMVKMKKEDEEADCEAHQRLEDKCSQVNLVPPHFGCKCLQKQRQSPSVRRRKPPVWKWMGTGRVASKGEAETKNEVAGVEAYLSSLRGHKSPKHKGIEEAKYAQKQLEALETHIPA